LFLEDFSGVLEILGIPRGYNSWGL